MNGARYPKPFHLNYFVISQLLHSIFYISYLNHRDKVHFYRFFGHGNILCNPTLHHIGDLWSVQSRAKLGIADAKLHIHLLSERDSTEQPKRLQRVRGQRENTGGNGLPHVFYKKNRIKVKV